MSIDPRGGHNHLEFNEDFFKTWSPPMSYDLGFLFADGALINATQSSRTCYTVFCNNDLDLLEQIKRTLNSSHRITTRKPSKVKFFKKTYLCNTSYRLRIGSRSLFKDLFAYGLTPDKSLTMNFPTIPNQYLPFFVRGYLDGDGCIYCNKQVSSKDKLLVIFTSGSRKFLEKLHLAIRNITHITGGTLVTQEKTVHRLRYRQHDSLKILNYIYQDLTSAPYLKRKYSKYANYLNQYQPN